MARINTPLAPIHTHEGAKAQHINPLQQLRRSVMACMLWEDQFYEDGVTIAQRIAEEVKNVTPEQAAEIAIEAREKMKLRHAPLWIVREMARLPKHRLLVADTLARVIQRADELTEFVALYWKDGKQPLSKQVKLGLARAFTKFDRYQLAKYNRDDAVKLRDVLFLSHAKPIDEHQAETFKMLVDGTLETPDTWEVNLSAGKDKKETWEMLLAEKKLGALALLRNLRNMQEVSVDEALVVSALADMKVERVLPFRFVSAAEAAPRLENAIEGAMLRSLSQRQGLPGRTVVIIDVSGSMYGANISAKSEMDRAKVACTLACMAREVCENPIIFATAGSDSAQRHQTAEVPARRGFGLVDAIYGMCRPLGGGGIFLTQAMDWIVAQGITSADRVIVITDEQDCDRANAPSKAKLIGKSNYLINVGSYQNGIGYGSWTHIDGFSESVLDYITAVES